MLADPANSKDLYKFLRIRGTSVFEGASPQFSKIYILTSVEQDASLIICIPNKPGQITADTLHDNIQNGLKTMKQEKEWGPEEVAIWLPQFKCGDGPLQSEVQAINYKVQDKPEQLFVQDVVNQSSIELYTPPLSQGNLQIEPS